MEIELSPPIFPMRDYNHSLEYQRGGRGALPAQPRSGGVEIFALTSLRKRGKPSNPSLPLKGKELPTSGRRTQTFHP